MPFFDLLLYIYIALSAVGILLYLPRLYCWLWARRKQPKLICEKQHNLALLIPARDESSAVDALFESINRQTYPRACFDAYVIVKDPADPTIAMAKEAGLLTHVVSNQTCKGDALDSCMKRILTDTPSRYDAYIIIDADCVLDDRFCEEMNNAMESGAEIICAKKRVKNYFFGSRRSQPISACCNGLIWTLIDNMGNTAKAARGNTCFTVGTGLLLRADVVRRNCGWPYKATITEDMELMHDIVLKGWKTYYYQHAIIYMEEADNHRVTNKRRRRWMTGVIDSKRLYAPKISADPVASRSYRQIYHTRNLWIVYGLVGLSVLFSLANGVTALLLHTFRSGLWFPALRNAVIGFAAIYLMFFVMTAFAIVADYENIKIPFWRKLLLLVVHPLFYMEYIPIVGIALFTHFGRSWDAIRRVNFAEERGKR